MNDLVSSDTGGARAIAPTTVMTAVRAASAAAPLSTIKRWACASDQAIGDCYTDARQRVALGLAADLVPISLPHLVDALHVATRESGELNVDGHLTLHGDVAPLQVGQIHRRGTFIHLTGRDESGAITTIAVHVCAEDPFTSVDWVDLDSLLTH